MKKCSLALLALAMGLAITPAALADTFSFTFTTPNTDAGGNSLVSANGFLTGFTNNDGWWTITDGTINIYGATSPAQGSGVLVQNPGAPSSTNNGTFLYDDLLASPPGKGNPFVNSNGLLFDLNGIGINIFSGIEPCAGCATGPFGGAGTNTYSLWENSSSGWYAQNGELNVNHLTPEPSSLLLLGTGLLGLALVLFRKAKPSQSFTFSM